MRIALALLVSFPWPGLARADLGTNSVGLLPAIGVQSDPVVVPFGGAHMVLWADFDPKFNRGFAVASRLDAQGVALDRPGVTLPFELLSQGGVLALPALGNCGGHVMVAAPSSVSQRIVTTELSVINGSLTPGAVTSVPPPLTPTDPQLFPNLVSAGSRCLLSWSEGSTSRAVWVDSAPQGPAFSLGVLQAPLVGAFDGANVWLTWAPLTTTGPVQALQIDSVGTVGPRVTLGANVSFHTWSVSPASPGNMFFAWFDGANVQTAVFAGDAGVLRAPAPAAMGVSPLSLASSASSQGFVVAMVTQPSAQSRVVSVDAQGQLTAARQLPVPSPGTAVQVSASRVDAGVLLITTARPTRVVDGMNLYSVVFDERLDGGVSSLVSEAAPAQRSPFVATLGSTALVGWTESQWIDQLTNPSYVDHAMLARVRADGVVLDPLAIDPSNLADSNLTLGVSAGATEFLASWVEAVGHVGRVVGINARTGAQSQPVAMPFAMTSGAFGGRAGAHLLVGCDLGTGTAVVLDDQANILHSNALPPADFAPICGAGGPLALATGPQGWLLARVVGQQLILLPFDAQGSPGALALRGSATGSTLGNFAPAVVAEGSGWLVQWSLTSGGCSDHVERLDSSLATLAQGNFYTGSLVGCADTEPALAFDGTNWVSVMRGRTSAGGLDLQHFNSALSAVDQPTRLEPDALPWVSPRLAVLPQGRLLFTYLRRVVESPFGSWRWRAAILPTPLPPIDAGLDAGSTLDAGTSAADAGSSVDAGAVNDAGTTLDAGVFTDAGLNPMDAGSESDSGVLDSDGGQGEPQKPQGCGCNALEGLQLLGVLLLAARRRSSLMRR